MLIPNEEKILEERKIFYSYPAIKFEMIKALHHRELAFLSDKSVPKENKKAIRYLLAFNLPFLEKHFKFMNVLKHPFNLYMSVAVLQNIPIFSYNLKLRRQEAKYKEFNEHYTDHIIGYDGFFDFDGKENFQKCYAEAKVFKKLLEEYKIPYYLINSSFHGFHFKIPAQYMPTGKWDDVVYRNNLVLRGLKAIYDFSCLDDLVIDCKRLCKLGYSYCCDGSICLPLDDSQFENFNEELVSLKSVLGLKIRDRGLLVRTYGLTIEKLKENVFNFWDEFEA